MKTITVNAEKCIKCLRCVKVCPSKIFMQDGISKDIKTDFIDNCIVCGHCVGVCPSSAVQHSVFPPEKIHKIDYSSMPTAEQVMLLCRTRRSNRAFSSKPIPDNMLEMILEAAHRAPTASNRQNVEFTIITDPQNIRKVSDLTIDVFASLLKKLNNPLLKPMIKAFMPGASLYAGVFSRIMKEREKGNDMILRGAVAVILIHTPKDSMFGCQDSNLAYQNASLMAESLSVSQFYTGFVCTAIKKDKKNKLAKWLGIDGTIHAGMALGMPEFRFDSYIDKKDIVVNKVGKRG